MPPAPAAMEVATRYATTPVILVLSADEYVVLVYRQEISDGLIAGPTAVHRRHLPTSGSIRQLIDLLVGRSSHPTVWVLGQ